MSVHIPFLEQLERDLVDAIGRKQAAQGGTRAPNRKLRRAALVCGALVALIPIGALIAVAGFRDSPDQRITTSGEAPATTSSNVTAGAKSGSWSTVAPAMDSHVFPLAPRVFWTGTEVLTLYGAGSTGDNMQLELFDPAAGTVRAVRSSILDQRAGHAAVWTGKELLVWGGDSGTGIRHIGAAYDPATDRWRPLPAAPGTSAMTWDVSVWTGSEMIVWGNQKDDAGYAYSPASDRWRALPPAPLSPRLKPAFVWTGAELIIWGGCDSVRTQQCDDRLTGTDELSDGAAYDARSDAWRPIAPSPLSRRDAPQALWTGREMIVWGGEAPAATAGAYGAAYDPKADRWRALPDAPVSPRARHVLVWTGAEMIVWGGSQGPTAIGDGASYRPDENVWTTLPPSPSPGRDRHGAVWTGNEVVIVGGYPPGPIAVYRPA